MKRALIIAGFLLTVLLAGLTGYVVMAEWLPPSQSTAVQVDVDLTKPDTSAAVAKAPEQVEGAEKTHETEPEEVPSAGDIEVEIVSREREHGAPLKVLIYHTHTYEAYEPAYDGEYKPTERWRTADSGHNIVRVGAELAKLLREEYGMIVVHDDTAFEPPRLDGAYQRSLEAVENYTARGETFDLYLDLHRDAYAGGRYEHNTIDVNGEPVARLMFLVGKGTGTYNGQAFTQLPEWEVNSARAEVMTEAINAFAEGVCRPVTAKASRYNQHVSTGAFLIEVGNNINTLDEALRAVPYLARAIAETSGGLVPDIPYSVDTQ